MIKYPKTTLTDGSPVTEDHREINPKTGQQKGYKVLAEEERKPEEFVRPVRYSYVHAGINPRWSQTIPTALVRAGQFGCGTITTMAKTIAETYARTPNFYTGTFCAQCKEHRPLEEFVWEGTREIVGS